MLSYELLVDGVWVPYAMVAGVELPSEGCDGEFVEGVPLLVRMELEPDKEDALSFWHEWWWSGEEEEGHEKTLCVRFLSGEDELVVGEYLFEGCWLSERKIVGVEEYTGGYYVEYQVQFGRGECVLDVCDPGSHYDYE